MNNVSALIANGVANISYTVSELAKACAALALNMPDLGKTPDVLGTPGAAGLSMLSQTFTYLAQAMSQLDAALTAAEITQYDTLDTFNQADCPSRRLRDQEHYAAVHPELQRLRGRQFSVAVLG